MIGRALRLAAAPLVVALILSSVGAAPTAGAGHRVRPMLRFQEVYRERLVRYHEDGESWIEAASSETFKIKAVIPFDRDLVDISSFGPDTEFSFKIAEAYFSGVLGDDPEYAPGDRTARVVVDEEEVWSRNGEDSRMRPVTIVNLKWTDEKWTVTVVQRPYADPEQWDDDGSYIAAPDWADVEEEYVPEEEYGLVPFRLEFSQEIESGSTFSLDASSMTFASRYAGVTKGKSVLVGSGDEAEVFYLNNVRLRGSGTPPVPPDDEVDPTISLEAVEAQRDDAGLLTGLYVSGDCADGQSGVYAVTARVDGGPPVVLWFEGGSEAVPDVYFDGFVPVSSPSGTVMITVYDMAKNSAEVLFPYGLP